MKVISMYLKKRENNYARGGFEWVLMGRIDEDPSAWCMKSYGFNKPDPIQVHNDIKLVDRAAEVFFKNIWDNLTIHEVRVVMREPK